MNPHASASRATASPRRGRPALASRTDGKAPSSAGQRRGARGAPPGRNGSGRGETPKARGERTRRRVAEALAALLDEGDPAPTAKAVANRAGVSVRLVFHHFEDMEALHRTVARAQFDRHWRGLRPVPPGLPIAQRIDRTVQQRAKLFDTISPVRRNAASLALRHEEIAKGFDYTNRLLRTWLEETFGHELKAAGRERRELLAAIEAAASWETWERLRRTQGFSSAAARRVVARTLRALLHA